MLYVNITFMVYCVNIMFTYFVRSLFNKYHVYVKEIVVMQH
jgi:hypothetical protein